MYALIKNNQVSKYPYSFSQLRKDNPNVSYPRNPSDEVLENFGVYRVSPSARPNYDPITQDVTEGTPELVGGVWSQTWVVTDATAEETAQREADAWANLRSTRNAKLSRSDWTQVADAPVDQAAWATYRQALRDLPQNTADPFNPVWPEEP